MGVFDWIVRSIVCLKWFMRYTNDMWPMIHERIAQLTQNCFMLSPIFGYTDLFFQNLLQCILSKNNAYGAICDPSYETRINMPGARGRYILWNCLLFYKETKYITIKITKSFWVPKLFKNVYNDKIAYWVLREVCWGKLFQISSSSVHIDHKYLIILILFKLR